MNKNERTGNAFAAVGYRMDENLVDPLTGKLHKHARKDVMSSGIALPAEYKGDKRLDWARSAHNLAFAMQHAERGKNANIGVEIMQSPIPGKGVFTHQQRLKLTRDFAQAVADHYGIAVVYGVHAPKKGRALHYHAHLMATTHQVKPDGLGRKSDLARAMEAGRDAGLKSSDNREARFIQGVIWPEVLQAAYKDAGLEWKETRADRGNSRSKAGESAKASSSPLNYPQEIFRQTGKFVRTVKSFAAAYEKVELKRKQTQAVRDNAGSKAGDPKSSISLEDRKALLRQAREVDREHLQLTQLLGKSYDAVGLRRKTAQVHHVNYPKATQTEISPLAYAEHRADKRKNAREANADYRKWSRLTPRQRALQEGRVERIRQQEAAIGDPKRAREQVATDAVKAFRDRLKSGEPVRASRVVDETRARLAGGIKDNDRGR